MAIPGPILIVDDDADDRRFILDSLATAEVGREVRVATNGREAIDYLSGNAIYSDRARFPFPCLMLLDIKMPFADGFEVLDWLRNSAGIKTMPVLMLTGSAQPADMERCAALGANAFLVKPVDLTMLGEMMTAVKTFWLRFHQAPPYRPFLISAISKGS